MAARKAKTVAKTATPEVATGLPAEVAAAVEAVVGGDAFVAPVGESPKELEAREAELVKEAERAEVESEKRAGVSRKKAREERIQARLAAAKERRAKHRTGTAKIGNIAFTQLDTKEPVWMVTEMVDGTEVTYTGALADLKGSQMVVNLANEALERGREAADKREDALASSEDGV